MSKHFVPAMTVKQDFPFQYKLSKIDVPVKDWLIDNTPDISLKSLITKSPSKDLEKQKYDIRIELIKKFQFSKYLDENSPEYIMTTGSSPSFSILINRYVAKKEKSKIIEEVKETWLLKAHSFTSQYKFNLVRSIEQLEQILETADLTYVGFDTETTGLNPEEDDLVGISLSFGNSTGYYIPIKHTTQYKEFNLGLEAVTLVYGMLVKAKTVFMFNSRFDMRVMEFTDPSFDMLKVNVIDTQITAHYADPDFNYFDLKTLEKHFLGFHRIDLFETLKLNKIKNFNFSLANPEDVVFYAAQDAISTYELGLAALTYFNEFGMAAQIDKLFLPRLMRLENYKMKVDAVYLDKELNTVIIPRLAELDEIIVSQIGNVNLNSPKQKQQLFESFGLDTQVKTKTGNMSTGNDAVLDMISRMESRGETYPEWLKLLGERAQLEKLNSSFFGKLLPQVENQNRIRINYRVGITSTGRLSSGQEVNFG